MTRITSYLILLGAMGSMAILLVMFWNSPDRELLLSVGAVVLISMSLLMERFWPHDVKWAEVPRKEIAGDIGSFVLVFGLIDGALKWLTPFAVLALLPTSDGVTLPLWQQVLLVTLWIELAAWGSHWAHHRFKPLWALHAMHHSTEHLYTLNNFRFHPFNHVLTHLVMILPPILVGVSGDAILIYTAISLPILLLQHSNVAFNFSGLNLIFNTNDLHRWHHSTNPSEGTKNLGRAFVFWDQMFGTYLRPDTASPSQVGLFQISKSFPEASRFWAQLAWPLSKDCCR